MCRYSAQRHQIDKPIQDCRRLSRGRLKKMLSRTTGCVNFPMGATEPDSDQPHPAERSVTVPPDDDVVVHGDAQGLGDRDDVMRGGVVQPFDRTDEYWVRGGLTRSGSAYLLAI
jgi:hypothetical protein